MNLQAYIFSQQRWWYTVLIAPLLFSFCQSTTSTEDTETEEATPEFHCDPDYFDFTFGEVSFKSNPKDSIPLKWEYFNDERYDHDNFDMDCECPEFLIDEDDVHYFSFFLHPEQDLQITIRKYWVNWSGHEFHTGGYDFNAEKLFENPRIRFQLTDKKTGCQYLTKQGRIYIRHFRFEKCIKAELTAELESQDCGVVVLKGTFNANYTGLTRSE